MNRSHTSGQSYSPRLGEWKAARRILCVRLDAMGDVLMTSPAIEALGRNDSDGSDPLTQDPGQQGAAVSSTYNHTDTPHRPQRLAGSGFCATEPLHSESFRLRSAGGQDRPRHITLLTSRSGAEAGKLMPFVDEIITAEVPWMKSGEAIDDSGFITRLADNLRARRFDAAVIFTVYSQNPLPAAILCMLADIPLRVAHCRENPYQLLTDWVREPEPEHIVRHEVRRQLDLVQYVAGRPVPSQRMHIHIPASARRNVSHLLKTLGIPAKNWVLIHPGATAASRRYPPSAYAAVARELHQETGCTTVFTGGAEEEELIRLTGAEARVPFISLAGRLSLPELAALIHAAPVVICNNTGPSHLAAAAGTPVVCLYALTNPQHTPWMVQSRVLYHDVPCRNCYSSTCREEHHHCLTKVMPYQVVKAALQLLKQKTNTADDHHHIDSGELTLCTL